MQDILTNTISHEHSAEEYAGILTAMMQAYFELFDKLPLKLRSKVIKVNRAYFKQSIDNV